MAFLTIGGVSVEVRTDGASEAEPAYIGGDSPAFAGSLRSTRRALRRAWTFTTPPLDATTLDALRDAIGLGAGVLCTGDAMPAGGVVCLVRATGFGYHASGLAHAKSVTIQCDERDPVVPTSTTPW
jgi:hypothetical protein